MPEFSYEDQGDNCVECNSRLEPDKYICTVCVLSQRFGAQGGLVEG